jgi:hypothetical protein
MGMKRFIAVGCYVGASILIGAASASAQSWGRPRLPAAGACFYEDINYGGRYFCASVGSSMEHVSGSVDDEISSIRVFGNAEVTVFRDSNFHGDSQRFDSSVEDLRASGLNDRVTSYRVGNRGYSQGRNQGSASAGGSYGAESGGGPVWGRSALPSTGACFYEHLNFGGRYFCVRLGESVAQVPGGTDNQISSIRIFGNGEVTVYRDSNFRGAAQRFNANVGNLDGTGLNDRITSLRVSSRGYGGGDPGGAYSGGGFVPTSEGNLEIFDDVDFKGRRHTLTGSTPDISAVGMGGAISSLRLPSGGTWQVCTEPNYRGRCRVVSTDIPDLRPDDWNDVIASARRVR